MATVKVRDNGDTNDVVFLGLTWEETVALRNAFSARADNRAYAQKYGETLMPAIRANSFMQEIHGAFKTEVRDYVEPMPLKQYVPTPSPKPCTFTASEGWE